MPICGRCQRRKAPDKCIYHPAPMTNGQRQAPSLFKESQSVQEYNTSHQRLTASHMEHGPIPSSSLLEDRLQDASPPVAGFLGPTSYSAVFTEGQSQMITDDNKLRREINIRGWQPSKPLGWDASKVKEGAEVLSLLLDLSRYAPALTPWYKVQCLGAINFYLRECIALLPSTLKDIHGQSKSLAILSHQVFLRTSTPCPLDANITMRQYPSFLMGENLGWEIVGIILTAVGLSAISMDEKVDDGSDSHIDWKDLAQQLLQAGDQCIAFCEQFGHLKDIGGTLILMNFVLHTQVYGDAGECAGARAI